MVVAQNLYSRSFLVLLKGCGRLKIATDMVQYKLVCGFVETLHVSNIGLLVKFLVFGFDPVKFEKRCPVVTVLERVGTVTETVELEFNLIVIGSESPKN